MMRKVILCFAHKDAYVLNTLIRQSLHGTEGRTDFYIHLDKKSEKLKSEILELSNVHFIKNNVSITWGDDSMMWALRNSINEIWEECKDFDYFVICTGQDLWVKPGIDSYLDDNKGKIWLDTIKKDKVYRFFLTHRIPRFLCCYMSEKPIYHPLRLCRHFYFRMMRLGLIGKKRVKTDLMSITFYYSFNWSFLPYAVFDYIHSFINNEHEFMKLYEDTYLPEDGFLGTVIMNSPFAKDVVFEDDNREGRSKSPTFWDANYGIEKGVHMPVISMNDVDTIARSGCWLARKFDSRQKDVVDYYNELIINQ